MSEETPQCNTCDKIEEKATAANPDKGMMEDEYRNFICQKCSRDRVKRVIAVI